MSAVQFQLNTDQHKEATSTSTVQHQEGFIFCTCIAPNHLSCLYSYEPSVTTKQSNKSLVHICYETNPFSRRASMLNI